MESDLGFARRLAKHTLALREVLGAPDILAVQEVENLETLAALAARVRRDDPRIRYTPYLIEGFDPTGIDTGFLVRETVEVRGLRSAAREATFEHEGVRHVVFPRPPLILDASFQGAVPFPLTVVGVHLRSLRNIEEDSIVRAQRKAQARELALLVQELQAAEPHRPLLVIGDFNAFEFSDGYVDILGEITGSPDPAGALLPAERLVDPPLENLILRLPSQERYSYVFRKNPQALDHALASRALLPFVSGVEFTRHNADAPSAFLADRATPLRTSDHDALVVFLGARHRRALRGDADGDARVGVSDAVAILEYLFRGTGIPCPEAADADGDGAVRVLDAVRLLLYLFRKGEEVPWSVSECIPAPSRCEAPECL